MAKKISIIDYGLNNLLSVMQAFKYCNAEVEVVNKPEQILKSTHLVLPGIGAFSKGMEMLYQQDFVEPIIHFIDSGKPFIGICLGMQMLMESTEEFGYHNGLSVLPGKVKAIPKISMNGKKNKVPHIGWNELIFPNEKQNLAIVSNVKKKSFVYFVHSYYAEPKDKNIIIAVTRYNDTNITAMINKDNIFGAQFHPEKSGEVGLKIIKNFINL